MAICFRLEDIITKRPWYLHKSINFNSLITLNALSHYSIWLIVLILTGRCQTNEGIQPFSYTEHDLDCEEYRIEKNIGPEDVLF